MRAVDAFDRLVLQSLVEQLEGTRHGVRIVSGAVHSIQTVTVSLALHVLAVPEDRGCNHDLAKRARSGKNRRSRRARWEIYAGRPGCLKNVQHHHLLADTAVE